MTPRKRSEVKKLGKVDPSLWSAEVVRSLCRRLPGGSAKTLRCEACHSDMWPCLCHCQESNGVVHGHGIRPPLVLEAAQQRVADHRPQGNLHLVRQLAGTHGADPSRLQVVSTSDADAIVNTGPRHACLFRSCDVVTRKADKYVVIASADKLWSQDCRLTSEQMTKLLKRLDPHLTIKKAENDVIHKVEVAYQMEDDAHGDLELVEFGGLWRVKDVAPGGLAYSAGARPGHILFTAFDKDGPVGPWIRMDAEDLTELLPGPFQMEVLAQEDHDAPPDPSYAGLTSACLRKSMSSNSITEGKSFREKLVNSQQFPLKLVFDALPEGWQVRGEMVNSNSKGCRVEGRSLQQLQQMAAAPATLNLTHVPYEVVSRKNFKLRHEHVWERHLESGQMDIQDKRREDAQLLIDWCLRSRLSPAQLCFTFKELQRRLTVELQTFEEERTKYEEVLLLKVRRLLSLEQRSNDTNAKRDVGQGSEDLLKEMRSLFQQVPLQFLLELSSACSYAVESNLGEVPLRRSKWDHSQSMAKITFQQLRQVIENLPRNVAMNPASTLRRANSAADLREKVTGGKYRLFSTENYLGHQAGHTSRGTVLALLKRLGQEVDVALAAANEGRLRSDSFLYGLEPSAQTPQAEARSPTVQWQDQEEEHLRNRDGRISKKDFEHVFHCCGITWMTSEEMAERFDSLDRDGSGYLTLGEVLSVTNHLSNLLLLVKDYQKELEAAGDYGNSREDLIQGLANKLLLGEDLVSPHNLANGAKITVSSNEAQMECSLLDYMGPEGCWKPVPGDLQPWICWELPGPHRITAAVTRGDPRERRGWITQFRLQFADSLGGAASSRGTGVFAANTNGVSRAWVVLVEPVVATCVWLYPDPGTWVNACCLRATLYGMRAPDAAKTAA